MKKTNQNSMQIIKRKLWAGLLLRPIIVCLAVIGLAVLGILIEGSEDKIALKENIPNAILVIAMVYIVSMFLLWMFNYRQKFNRLYHIYNNGNPPHTLEEGWQRLKI